MFGQETWIEKMGRTIILGFIILLLQVYQVRRLFAMQNLFQVNMPFPTVFGIKIRNLIIFSSCFFFLSGYIQSQNN